MARLGYSTMDIFLFTNSQWRKHVCVDPTSGAYMGASYETMLAYIQWMVDIGLCDGEAAAQQVKVIREQYSEHDMVPLAEPLGAPEVERVSRDRLLYSTVDVYLCLHSDERAAFQMDANGKKYIAVRQSAGVRFLQWLKSIGAIPGGLSEDTIQQLESSFHTDEFVPLPFSPALFEDRVKVPPDEEDDDETNLR